MPYTSIIALLYSLIYSGHPTIPILCLLSVLSYYELTTYNPWEYQAAIHRGDKKPKLPEYPPIKIMYLADAGYNIGGIDLMKEGLKNYLKTPEKNITKRVPYAEKLRIERSYKNISRC